MITVQRISGPVGTIAINVIVDTHESMEAFKELVQRATNLWPDATPEIKEFADMITEGHVQQDYKSQDTSGKKKREYKISRIVNSPSNPIITVVCSCGLSEILPMKTLAYQCKNCKTNHNITEYVR